MCIVVDRDLERLESARPDTSLNALAAEEVFASLVDMALAMTGARGAVLSLDGEADLVVRGMKARSAVRLREEIERRRALCTDRPWHEGAPCNSDDPGADRSIAVFVGGCRFAHFALLPLRDDESCIGWLALADLPTRLAGDARRGALRLVRNALTGQIQLAKRVLDAQRQAQRLRDAVWASVDWMWETDAQKRYVWLSRDEAGHPGDVLPPRLGASIPDGPIVDWLGRPMATAGTLHALMSSGARLIRVISQEAGDGDVRLISRCAVPLRWPDGSLKGYRGSARDVTDGVRAKAAVWQREQRLRLSTTALPGAVFRIQGATWLSARMDEADVRLERLLGLRASRTPCSLRALLRCTPREDRARLYAQLHANPRGPLGVQLRLQCAGGPTPWLDLSTSVARDSSNGALYWNAYLVAADAPALERPAESANEVAQSPRHGHGDCAMFAARLGHELKTPLNAIVGLTQLIQMRRQQHDESSQDAWLDQISRTGRHMAETIDTLLSFARADAASVQLVLEAVSVVEVLQDAIAILRQSAELRGIQVHLDAAPTVHARCDRRALRQVMLNLLSNALKYNVERGQVWVSVAATDRVRIEVRDNGPGVQAAQLALMFEPFERLGAERRNVEGHGLGLAISRELLRAMQGTIAAFGNPAGGCTFVVVLAPAETSQAIAA